MRVEPAASLVGHIAVPGDKSISHRALLLAAIAEGETRIVGFGRSGDTEATIAALRALGVKIYEAGEDVLRVYGQGLRGLVPPRVGAIDCANSGTLLRLLAGILAGHEGRFELTGDESLRTRPMERVAEPLRRMGATVETAEGGTPPLVVEGGKLSAVSYELPVASSQVKSATLLAGLYAEGGETTVVEPSPTRDHTEIMLQAAGVRIVRRPTSVSVWPPERLVLGEVEIPGDFSSAAPFIVAATLLAGSEVTIHGVGVNPHRIGLMNVLERMGARITVFNRRRVGGEAVADLDIHSSELTGAKLHAREIPGMIDELPLFALAAASARGDTVVRGAEELRAKESDRIEALVDGLRATGAHIRATPDGFKIRGVPTRLRGGRIRSYGDHRIAMLGAIAGLYSREGVDVEGAECVSVSFPGFFPLVDSLRSQASQ